MEAPIITTAGTLVGLGPLRADLMPLYQRWFNDLETLRTLSMAPVPLTLEQETQRYERLTASEREVPFLIYELTTSKPIGTTSLHDIDLRNRTAEFGIVIGDSSARGRGYGTETAQLMLDYAFHALGLENVMLRVVEFNHAGRRAYEKAGFREIGRRRQSQAMGGRLWDVILMDCIASQFSGSTLSAVVTPDPPQRT